MPKLLKSPKLLKILILLAGIGLVLLWLAIRSPRQSNPTFKKSLFGSDYQASFSSVGINANLGLAQNGAKIAVSRDNSQLEMTVPLAKASLKKENEELVYRVPEEVVELHYQLLDNGLKEDIVLNKKPGNNQFPVELNTKNLIIKQTPDGVPVFFDSKTGQYQFHFLKPFAQDAKGSITYGVKYQIAQKNLPKEILSPINQVLGDNTESGGSKKLLGELLPVPKSQSGVYVLTITVDESWLFDQERAFPITIDPTVVYDTSSKFAQGTLNRITNTGSPNLEAYYQQLAADPETVILCHLDETSSGTAYDRSGNNNNGTAGGTTIVDGKLSKARSFDGTDDYVNFGDIDALDSPEYLSVMLWFKRSIGMGITTNHGIPNIVVAQTSNATNDNLEIGTKSSSIELYVDTAGTDSFSYDAGIQNDTWYHLAMTYNKDDANELKLYLNGKLVSQWDTPSGPLVSSVTSPFSLGLSRVGSDNWGDFNGIIDEVYISKRALTPEGIKAAAQRRPYGVYSSEVIDLAATGVAAWNSLSWTELGVTTGDGEGIGNTASMVTHWKFNETSGTTAANSEGSCGSSCNGALTNFASTGSQDAAAGTGWTSNNRRWGTGALMFDGTNDTVSIGSESSFDFERTQAFSIEAWIKYSSTTAAARTIYSKMANASPYTGYEFWVNSSNKLSVYLINTYSSNLIYVTAQSSIDDGNWHYVAMTYDGSSTAAGVKVYLDAKQEELSIAYDSLSATILNNITPMIGSRNNSAYYFRGVIDSTRVYSRALSASEILANYNAGNIELQTRVGASADPNDGTWEAWKPTTSESQIVSMDSDQTYWSWDNTATYMPKTKTDESTIKMEGNGSMKLSFGPPQAITNTVGLWHFEETGTGVGTTFYDSSGNNKHGTGTNMPTITEGFSGKGRDFNGSSNYINLGTGLNSITTLPVTIETWVKIDSQTGSPMIVQQNENTTNYYGFRFGVVGTYQLDISYGDGTAIGATSRKSKTTAINAVTTGQWYHLAGVIRGATDMSIYINGADAGGTYTGSGGNMAVSGNGNIGRSVFATTSYFDGIIDEVRVSNSARSAEEIAEAYRAGRDHRLSRTISASDLSAKTKIPFFVAADRQGTFLEVGIGESAFANYEPDANTIGLWHLDEEAGIGGSGPSSANWFKDYSGNANHGTAVGTALTQGKIGKGRIFDGTDDYISTSNLTGFNTGNTIHSIEAWIKPNALPTTRQWPLLLGNAGAGSHHWTWSSTGVLGIGVWGGGQCSVTPVIGSWNYVTATFDGTTIRCYFNGALVGSGAATFNLAGVPLSLAQAQAAEAYFNGAIDGVRISNIARSADVIRQAYEVGLRTHPITIDFKAKLTGNLIANSSDYSFTIDSTQYGAQYMGDNLYAGDKVIVKEKVGATEYLAQGTVTSVTASSGAVTVKEDGWDTGSTFPAGGYSVNATVFKWQREYFDITGSLSTHRDATTKITLRITDGSSGANVWLDDFRSVGSYLTNPAGSTITSSLGKRYFQYRAIFSSNDSAVSPSLTSATLDYEILNPPSGCRMEESRFDNQIIVRWNDTNSYETGYKIEKSTDGAAFGNLTTTAADATSHTDNSISGNHTYQYRIRAENSTSSAYSDWCYTSGLNLGQGSFKFEGVRMEGVRID